MNSTDANMIRLFVKSTLNPDMQMLAYGHLLTTVGYRLPIQQPDSKSEECRLSVLERIRYDWYENEKRRKLRKREIQEATRCKAVRLVSGVYMYIDIETRNEIDAEEYQIRYSAFLKSQYDDNEPCSPTLKRLNNESSSSSTQYCALDILVSAALMSENSSASADKYSSPLRKRNINEISIDVDNERVSSIMKLSHQICY
mmetsp:Transcript_37050/g.37710  ORF Transcript_37050/g.37710 Transcript_37050/m.37710 type:complete len:200 (-) Transcript_37050:475-1074(-)